MASFNGALRTIPMLRALVPFVAGIVAVENFDILHFDKADMISIVGLLLCTIMLHWLSRRFARLGLVASISLMLCLFYTGASITSVGKHPYSPLPNGQKIQVLARVTDMPQEKKKSYKLTLEISQRYQESLWTPFASKVVAYLPKTPAASSLSLGDVIVAEVIANPIEGFPSTGNFNYPAYMAHKQIYNRVFVIKNRWHTHQKHEGFSIKMLAYRFSQHVSRIYDHAGMAAQENAVLKALMLGIRADISPDLLQAYSLTGAMHILAVSGLHVGILYLILCWVLFFMNGRWLGLLRTAITLAAIWFYAFMTGFTPSVERAAIMFSLITIARSFQLSTSIFNTLAATALIILAISPLDFYDIGFQLSFLAVTGIVCSDKHFAQWYQPSNVLVKYFYEILSVSMAAQLFTMPLSLYYFGQFPSYFLLTNLVAIPVSFVAMVLGIAVVPLFYSFDFLFSASSWLLEWSVKIQNLCISTISQLHGASINVSIPFAAMVGLLILLAGAVAYMEIKKMRE